MEEEKAEQEAAEEARKMEADRLRMEEERAELEAAEEARKLEADRLRMEEDRQISEAEIRSRAELEQFLLPRADLEHVTEEVAHARVEVEASLHKALEEDRRHLEMQQAMEQSSQPSSAELLWLEPEICQPTDIDQRLLEETHLQQDQQQLIEEAQYTAEIEEQQFAEFEKQMEHAEHLRYETQEHYSYAAEELE
jgi:hypothetical protein